MRRSTRRFAPLAVGLGLCLAVAGCSFGGGIRKSPAGSLTGGGKVLVFEAAQSGTSFAHVSALTAANRALVFAIAPYWFHVHSDGSVSGSAQPGVVKWAKSHHVALEPLINNARETSAFLTRPAARSRAAANVADLVLKNGFAGINIDFEPLPKKARTGMTAFIKALYGRLHPKHKRIEISIIPESSVSAANSSAYDYKALAASSDAIVLMTYDQHDDSVCPGPVAELSWVKERLGVALKDGVPAGKIRLGIADYGYDWTGCGSSGTHATTVGLTKAEALSGGKVTRDSQGDPHFTYTKGGTHHVVWFEDAQSVAPKIRLAVADKLQGLALWRAGYENQAYWNAIKKYLRR